KVTVNGEQLTGTSTIIDPATTTTPRFEGTDLAGRIGNFAFPIGGVKPLVYGDVTAARQQALADNKASNTNGSVVLEFQYWDQTSGQTVTGSLLYRGVDPAELKNGLRGSVSNLDQSQSFNITNKTSVLQDSGLSQTGLDQRIARLNPSVQPEQTFPDLPAGTIFNPDNATADPTFYNNLRRTFEPTVEPTVKIGDQTYTIGKTEVGDPNLFRLSTGNSGDPTDTAGSLTQTEPAPGDTGQPVSFTGSDGITYTLDPKNRLDPDKIYNLSNAQDTLALLDLIESGKPIQFGASETELFTTNASGTSLFDPGPLKEPGTYIEKPVGPYKQTPEEVAEKFRKDVQEGQRQADEILRRNANGDPLRSTSGDEELEQAARDAEASGNPAVAMGIRSRKSPRVVPYGGGNSSAQTDASGGGNRTNDGKTTVSPGDMSPEEISKLPVEGLGRWLSNRSPQEIQLLAQNKPEVLEAISTRLHGAFDVNMQPKPGVTPNEAAQAGAGLVTIDQWQKNYVTSNDSEQGSKIIVEGADGQKYIYEINPNNRIDPSQTYDANDAKSTLEFLNALDRGDIQVGETPLGQQFSSGATADGIFSSQNPGSILINPDYKPWENDNIDGLQKADQEALTTTYELYKKLGGNLDPVSWWEYIQQQEQTTGSVGAMGRPKSPPAPVAPWDDAANGFSLSEQRVWTQAYEDYKQRSGLPRLSAQAYYEMMTLAFEASGTGGLSSISLGRCRPVKSTTLIALLRDIQISHLLKPINMKLCELKTRKSMI
ncbi:MAG: hypothetical protein HC850_01880, partial [Rhodomicrobium sp.]|nr:hypothetical protein [Rhodomicrobium sp.]